MRKIAYVLFAAVMISAVSISARAQSKEENRTVSPFNRLSSAGSFKVHVTLGATESVKVVADADIIDRIETVVEDNTLKIRVKKDGDNWGWGPGDHHAEVYVITKNLNAISNAGSGSINVDGQLNGDHINVSVAGSGNVTTSVKASQLHVSITGSGSLNIKGSSSEVNASITGSGRMDGKDLSTSTASFRVAGSGNAYIKADKELEAHIAGSGSVYYSGDARVDSHTIGSGRVTRVN